MSTRELSNIIGSENYYTQVAKSKVMIDDGNGGSKEATAYVARIDKAENPDLVGTYTVITTSKGDQGNETDMFVGKSQGEALNLLKKLQTENVTAKTKSYSDATPLQKDPTTNKVIDVTPADKEWKTVAANTYTDPTTSTSLNYWENLATEFNQNAKPEVKGTNLTETKSGDTTTRTLPDPSSNIEVSFDETLQNPEGLELWDVDKNTKVSANVTLTDNDKGVPNSKVVVDPNADLPAGNYELRNSGGAKLADVAVTPNAVTTKVTNFNVPSSDLDAPTINTASSTSGNQVEVGSNIQLKVDDASDLDIPKGELDKIQLLDSSDKPVAGKVTMDGNGLIQFDPDNDLAAGQKYTLKVPANVIKDKHGNKIDSEQTLQFTTKAAPSTKENDAPTINLGSSTSGDQVEVGSNIQLKVEDASGLDIPQTELDKIQLLDSSDKPVAGKVTMDGNGLIQFDPDNDLAAGQKYTLKVPANVIKDKHGNKIDSEQTLQFTTKAAPSGSKSTDAINFDITSQDNGDGDAYAEFLAADGKITIPFNQNITIGNNTPAEIKKHIKIARYDKDATTSKGDLAPDDFTVRIVDGDKVEITITNESVIAASDIYIPIFATNSVVGESGQKNALELKPKFQADVADF